MFLHSLATAVPPTSLTQAECARIASSPQIKGQLNRRSQVLVQAVLRGDSGVERRHFAINDIPGVFAFSADELNERFRQEAPRLAENALRSALEMARLNPRQLDGLIICTCTGYLCPGLTSYVAERIGLPPNALLHDVAGLGCGAAIPTLRVADAFLRVHPNATIATVAVEVCSAAFYLDDDPGVLISACLFGDGAAAAIWKSGPGTRALRCHQFRTRHEPQHRDRIRFEQRHGKLRNLLDGTVPELAAKAVATLFQEESTCSDLPPPCRILAHPGGRDVVNALERALPGHRLEASRKVLRSYGNMSSPSVLFVLDEALRNDTPAHGQDWWLVSFGAGFSAHACRLSAA